MSLPESLPFIPPIHSNSLPPSPVGNMRELVRNPLGYFLTITRQYGDVICYRPEPDRAYLVNHPDHIRYVLVDNQRNYSKETISNQAFKKTLGPNLIVLEGDTWLRQRRLMQPFFHRRKLEPLDSMIVQATSEMLDQWQERYTQGQPVDIAREMAALTMTITAQALFGVSLAAEAREIGEVINGVAELLERPNHPRLQQAARQFSDAVERMIAQRRQDFTPQGDLLSSMMTTPIDETGRLMDDQELCSEVKGLLLAGYETTANALTWTYYLLSQNQWAGERMRSEVRQVLGGQAPAYTDLPQLAYTRQVLDESLRLFPPAWIIGRRAISNDTIGNYHVPAGTVIAICIYTLHRHPAYWENPDQFDPQRFSPERSAFQNHYAYIPFGAGPRQCLGANFALLEAGLILALIAQRFELSLLPGIQVQPQALFVLRPNRDLLMTLHP